MGIENLYKLNTHHDYFHMHKTLGAIVLLHFIYRFSHFFRGYHTMFLDLENPDTKFYNSLLLCMHGMLTVSSLIYKIPKNSNSVIPLIYEDFRTQNIFSTFRAIFCILCYIWFSPLKVDTIETANVYFIITVINGTSIVLFPSPPMLPITSLLENCFTVLTLFFGLDISFITLFYLQIIPFLMTLAKKGIINRKMFDILYSGILTFAISMMGSSILALKL